MKKFKICCIALYILSLWIFNTPILACTLYTRNDSLLKIYNSLKVDTNPWEYGTIERRGYRDLTKAPGIHLKPDGTFLFESSNKVDKQTDLYVFIRGTMKDDVVRFNGRFIINELNLLGGKNTLILDPGTVFLLDPGITNENPKSLKFYNIANFDIKEGVKIQCLHAIYGSQDININFSSQDSSNEKNNILMQDVALINNKSDQKGYINIQNAAVQVQDNKGFGGNFILSSNHETINLADAKVDNNGKVNGKTRSKLLISKCFSKPGGVLILNMGKYSIINVQDGSIQINSHTTNINMDKGSAINSALLFRAGNTTINIKDNTKNNPNKNEETTDPITVHSISFNSGNNVINIGNNASFLVATNLNSNGGNLKILVGKNSDFTIRGEVGLFGSNYLSLDELCILNANIKFTSASFNNNVVVNTGNSFVTLNGFINASGNNDTLKILGTGVFKITSQLVDSPLNGFNNIELNQARIEFNSNYKQLDDIKDINICLTLLPNTKEEKEPRIWLKNGGVYDNTNLNLIYKGVTEHLGNVNDKYSLILLRADGRDNFTKLSDIGIKNINFNSAIYKLKYYIEQNRDIKVELEKYRTFKDSMLQSGDVKHKEEYIVQIANFLDLLIKEKNKKYFDLLDKLAMLDVFTLKETLKGFVPVNNTILFNLNNSVASEFNQVILDAKPYKLVKNELTLWSNYTYFKADIKNFQSAKLTSNNQLMFGAEYSVCSFLKFGSSFGYSRPHIGSNNGCYDADVNYYYYSAYSTLNITQKLYLDFNVGFLNSNYDLNRYINIINYKVTSNPKFNQVNLDTLLSYKIKLNDLLVVPYISFNYTNASMDKYIETGEKLTYIISESNFNDVKGGVGIKVLTVSPFAGGVIMPNLIIGLYSASHKTESTKAQFIDSKNIWIPFITDDYSGLYGKCKIGFTYRLLDIITLDFNAGFNVGKSLKSYDFGTTINLAI